jgi:hypothetical protein
MHRFSRMSTQVSNGFPGSEQDALEPVVGLPAESVSDNTHTVLHLDSCALFERITVRTQTSVYELIVLSGAIGEVLIRGGRFFPRFSRAIVIGAAKGGGAVALRTIVSGLSMEFRGDHTLYATTRVEAISRNRLTSGDRAPRAHSGTIAGQEF